MLIEIKGIQFVNKGAELMLHAILDKVHGLWPDAEICIEPDQNSPYLKRASIGAYQKIRLVKNRFDFTVISYFLPLSIRNFFKSSLGIVTEADVDMVLDASGFLYSEQWNYLPLKQSSFIAQRFNKKGKRYILMPQALGPFLKADYQAAAKVLTENATLVFARDEQSKLHIEALTRQSRLYLAPDFTNLLVPEILLEYKGLAGQVAVIPNSKMLSSSNNNEQWRKNYISTLVNAIECILQTGQQAFLLNHEGKDDQAICQQINQQLSMPIDVVSPSSALSIKAIIGQSSWIISSRYHGCVSALSQNIPCLGTSWSHKYEKLFEDYGHLDWLLKAELNKKVLAELIQTFSNNIEPNKASLIGPSSKIKAEAEEVWSTICNELKV